MSLSSFAGWSDPLSLAHIPRYRGQGIRYANQTTHSQGWSGVRICGRGHHANGGNQARAKLFSTRALLFARHSREGQIHEGTRFFGFFPTAPGLTRHFRIVQDDSFTIDPTIYGNVARMLNHSCEPNVTTLEVTVTRDNNTEEDETDAIPKVPRAGFFAIRDIQPNEELCIDYSPGRHGDELQRVIQCFCGSTKCKGWLF